MVTMSNIKTECLELKDQIDNDLEMVDITLTMDKETFERFLKGNLSNLDLFPMGSYRDDLSLLQIYFNIA